MSSNMSATVLLKDIIDALEMQFEESSSFLDLDTGRVETVPNDLLGEADASVGSGITQNRPYVVT